VALKSRRLAVTFLTSALALSTLGFASPAVAAEKEFCGGGIVMTSSFESEYWKLFAGDDVVVGTPSATLQARPDYWVKPSSLEAGKSYTKEGEMKSNPAILKTKNVIEITPSEGVSYKYQWLRDGKAISGATNAKYTATSADVGHKLSVQSTASKPGYKNKVMVSQQSGKVRNPTGVGSGGSPANPERLSACGRLTMSDAKKLFSGFNCKVKNDKDWWGDYLDCGDFQFTSEPAKGQVFDGHDEMGDLNYYFLGWGKQVTDPAKAQSIIGPNWIVNRKSENNPIPQKALDKLPKNDNVTYWTGSAFSYINW